MCLKHMKRFGVMITVALLACPFQSLAEEQPRGVHVLDAVVVSATRTETPAFDVPQNVSVLTGADIMASPFERVEDIVRTVPGMYNFRHHALHTNGIVSPLKMRGVGNNRILLLVDGVPQNDNFNNAIAWVGWGHIPKDAIERIEIVRGPTSTLYGSEGMGGVIHIVTKNPGTERRTAVRAQAGSADAYGGDVFHSRKIDDFGFLIAGGYEESDGFYMTENPASYEIKRYREVGKVFGKATWDLGPGSDISLAALYFDQDAGQGRKFFHNDLKLDQYWMTYTRDTDAIDVKALAYLNRADKTAFQDTAGNDYTSAFRDEQFKGTQTWGADLQATLFDLKPLQLTVGASFKEARFRYREEYRTSDRDAGAKGVQQTLSPFANLDFRFLDENLILNLGARYDHIKTSDGKNRDTRAGAGKPAYSNTYDSVSEGSFSPKLGVAFHPDNKTTLRVSGGKGFRAPSLFELYKVHVRQGGAYYREANPDLKPEEIWSWDIGAERFLTDRLWARTAFYQSFARDYIGDRLVGTGTFSGSKTRYEYVLDNIGKVDIHGIEAELQWWPVNDIMLFTNYAWNISKVKEDTENADLEGNYLPNDPRHNVHAGFRYQNPRIANVSLIANYYSVIYFNNENTLRENGYFTLDASISRKFIDMITVYVNAENIFDKRYPMFRSASSGDTIAPGVIVAGGVKFEF